MFLKDWFILAAAISTSGGAVASLYFSWQGLVKSKFVFRLLGLACVVASYYLLKILLGWEYSLAITIITPVIFAWFFTFINRQSRATRKRESKVPKPLSKSSSIQTAKVTLGFIAGLLLSFIVSILICTVCAHYLPMREVNRIIFSAFLLPVLWGGLCSWALVDGQFKRAHVAILIIGIISFTILYLK